MSDTSKEPVPKSIQSKSLKQSLFDILGVTFGVLLAFLLNEWRIETKKSSFVERSLISIEAELSANYDKVMEARNYHLELYPDILDITEDKGDLVDFQRNKFRGIRPPQIQSAAYDISIQRAVLADIPLDEAKKIVSAYTSLQNLEDLHGRYASTAFNAVLDEEIQGKKFGRFLSVAFMDFLYAEEETMLSIQQIVDKPKFERWYESAGPWLRQDDNPKDLKKAEK